MIHTLRSLALFIVVVLATPAMALDGPGATARATQAVTALQTYNDGVRAHGSRPDYTSAPVAELLRAVFDIDTLAALPEPTARDVGWLIEWGNAANGGYKQIILFGQSPGQKPDEAIVGRNLDDYEDQIATAMNFLIRLLARQMDASALFMSELPKAKVTPARIEGFRLLRSGAAEVMQGALITVAQGIKPANARMLMTALDETRSTWINALYPDDRTKAMALLKQITKRVTDKEVTDTAAGVLTAFADAGLTSSARRSDFATLSIVIRGLDPRIHLYH